MVSEGIIDSHLHVWSDSFPFAPGKEPPESLSGEESSAEKLLEMMDANGIQASLIVQPSNYMFDHKYILSVAERYPDRFKCMMLLDPTQTPDAACDTVRHLVTEKGCVGIRFNPGLWPEGKGMDDETGRAVSRLAGELGIPIGIMAFTGLKPLLPSIRSLLSLSNEKEGTTVPRIIIDHMGFPRASPGEAPSGQAWDEEAWEGLLQLGRDHPQVYVKLSALFRVSSTPLPSDYPDLPPRFDELLGVYSAERLLYGSDFPWTENASHEAYVAGIHAVRTWAGRQEGIEAILGGTARNLFGFEESTH